MKNHILMLLFITCNFDQSKLFIEKEGYVEIEAESFHKQQNSVFRTWQIID